MLSSLVARPPFSIGAWASHIFVNSSDAAKYGQDIWGVPAQVLLIDHDKGDAMNSGPGEIVFAKNEIRVSGWTRQQDTTMASSKNNGVLDLLKISLPSFSGLLLVDASGEKETTTTPLLQYPLSIIRPSSIRTVSFKSLSFQTDIDEMTKQVQSLLEASRPLLSVSIQDVELVTGIPTVIGK